MINVLRALQALMVCAWLVPLVLFAPYAWRPARAPFDTLRAAVWCASLSVTAFPIQWLAFGSPVHSMPPPQLAVWSALYVLGTLAAMFLTWATADVCRAR